MEYFIGTGRLLTQGAAFQRTAPALCAEEIAKSTVTVAT